MIHVSKQLFYTLLIAFLLVTIAFCIVAVINRDTDQLVQNISMAITATIGFFLRYDEGEGTSHTTGESKTDDENDDVE